MRFALAAGLVLAALAAGRLAPDSITVGGSPLVAAPTTDSLAAVSPDGALTIALGADSTGALTWRVVRFGTDVVLPSPLGVVLTDGRRLTGGRIVAVEQRARDTTWTTVWGERERVRDAHREVAVTVETADSVRFVVRARAFDDGVAFRYEWPRQTALDSFAVADEVTGFRFAQAPMAWWIPAYERERYEYLHRHSRLPAADTVHTPLTLETPDGLALAVHEAALVDYASMTLAVQDSASLKADLVPWSTGVKVYANAPAISPWRVLLVADDAAGLAESDLVLNLNEPSQLEATDWIAPMRYVGIWWDMHLDTRTWASGERHGATTAYARRMIDFAAANGFGGVLVEGWNTGWDGNWIGPQADFSFTEPYPDFALDSVAAYARERGVALIGHHETGSDVPAYEAQMDSAFALYERLGVPAVKTGYVGWSQGVLRTAGPGLAPGDSAFEWHHGQYMVRHHQRVVETAARHRVMVNIHEPIKDTGLRRTWPNLMTREGARGQEWNAWDPDGGNPPEHDVVLPFTRLLAGPLDFTPGVLDVMLARGNRPSNRINTTVAKQLALTVVLYSPLQMSADLPESYEAAPVPFQFLRDVPADWSDSRWLHARIGDVATVARRARGTDDWFLGAITDETGRRLRVPLAFLDAGRTYVAEVYRDADGADWRTHPTALTVERGTVTAQDVLRLRLAPGGGAAVRFRPASLLERVTMEELATLAGSGQ